MWFIILASVGTALALPADMPMPYDYAYGVNGAEYGDIKAHKEVTSLDGRTEGEYRWLQPNGLYIVTRYFVDGDSGYQATVSEEAGPDVANFYTNSQDEQISSSQQNFESQQTVTSQGNTASQQNFNNQQSQTSQQSFSQEATNNQQSQGSSVLFQGATGLVDTSQVENLGVIVFDNSEQSSTFSQSGETGFSQQVSSEFSQVDSGSQSLTSQYESTDSRQGTSLSSVSQSSSSGDNQLDQLTTVAQIQVRPTLIGVNTVDASRITGSTQSGTVSLSSSSASSSSSQSATSGSSQFTQSSSVLSSGASGASQSLSTGISAGSSLTGVSGQSAFSTQNNGNKAALSTGSSSSSISSSQQSSSSSSSNQQSSSFSQQSGAAALLGDVKSIAVILAGSPEAVKLRKN